MLKRCYSLMLMVFLLAACVHHKPKMPSEPVQASRIKQVRELSSFNQIDAQGKININLHTGYKKPQILLSGDPRDLVQIKTVVSNNTLYLALGKGFPQFGPIYADVRGQFLNKVRFQDTGTIMGDHLYTRALDVYLVNTENVKLGGSIGLRVLDIRGKNSVQISGINSPNLLLHLEGSPKVQLSGVANITSLTMKDSAWFSFYWIKSNTLKIRAESKAIIQLAGAVNRLDVELWGNARFKGRYLRAQRSFVKTHEHSVAEISVANHQSNLATDASDIYYYNLPNTRADFMAFDGSVLDMREWDQIDFKDFDRYNKQFP